MTLGTHPSSVPSRPSGRRRWRLAAAALAALTASTACASSGSGGSTTTAPGTASTSLSSSASTPSTTEAPPTAVNTIELPGGATIQTPGGLRHRFDRSELGDSMIAFPDVPADAVASYSRITSPAAPGETIVWRSRSSIDVLLIDRPIDLAEVFGGTGGRAEPSTATTTIHGTSGVTTEFSAPDVPRVFAVAFQPNASSTVIVLGRSILNERVLTAAASMQFP